MSNFTRGPWKWWTSCSWNRLKGVDDHGTANVLEPTVARDGHPDCYVREDDMRLIAAAPELYAAGVRALHAIDGILPMHDGQHEHIELKAAFDALEMAIHDATEKPL